MDDTYYMHRVLELARQGIGTASPNPMVGTVIVKDGRIIGEGYHRRYGEKHAEIMAIDAATESVAGATLYCNLEPCTNDIPHKKTPPCSERIIREKIGRVVLANRDPNPHVNGRGIAILQHHGIQVDLGILQEEASILNEAYFTYIQTGRPFIHLKIAQSLDGRIATMQGKSKWITNEEAQRRVHQWRAAYDAVLVGINTVLHDNPSLTVRWVTGKNPSRIILDNHLQIPESARVLTENSGSRTIIFTGKSPEDPKALRLRNQGIEILQAPCQDDIHLNLEEVLSQMGRQQITSLLVEGGGEIFTSFIRARLFDKVSFFIAPIMIGTGIQSVGNLGISDLKEACRLEKVSIEIIEHQALFQGYRDYNSLLH